MNEILVCLRCDPPLKKRNRLAPFRGSLAIRMKALKANRIGELKRKAKKRFLDRVKKYHPDTRAKNHDGQNPQTFLKELALYRFIMALTPDDLSHINEPITDMPLPWDWETKTVIEGFQII